MNFFLKEIKQCRSALKKNRKKFWKNNKENFEENIQKIIKTQKLPKGWKIYLIVSRFLSNKKILPFNYDSWSTINLIAATKKQGFEIMMFFNKDRAEFLSVPALMPLVIHELKHVKQAAKFPKKFVKAAINDKIARDFEVDAEKDVKNISDEFKKEKILESILYCYDLGKWKTAQKMADFFYKEREEIYSGGYDKEMTKEEYEMFLKARKNRDINIFIDFFKIV